MRNARRCGKAADLAWEETQAALLGRFFARFKQRLQAEADAEERNTGADAFEQRFPHLQLVERAHHLSEMSHAGKNDFRRDAQARSVSNEFVLRADLRQRVLNRAQIARAVIEDRDHSSPFVDGSCSFSRGSFEQA